MFVSVKMKKSLISILVFSLILLPLVSSFMPAQSHFFIHQMSMSEQQTSELYKACAEYPTECYTGNLLNDVSVIFYWTQGYKYAVTHSPNFCRAMIEDSQNKQELACAVGACIHQPADIASHSIYQGKKGLVPTAIENSFLANSIIHIFAEQKVDNWVVRNNPGIKDNVQAKIANYETCVPLFKRVMLGEEEYSDITPGELDDIFAKFIKEVQTSKTGYDIGYKQKSFLVNFKSIPFLVLAIYSIGMLFFTFVSVILLLKIIKRNAKLRHWIAIFFFGFISIILIYIFIANATGGAFQAIINVAKPISELVPIGNSPEYYVNNGIENTKAFLNQGEAWLTNTEASGFVALGNADRKVLLADYIIIGILSLGFGAWTWYLLKSNKIKTKELISF